LEVLKTDIESWKKLYLLISPFKGRISMTSVWSNNQFISEGSKVMTVISNNVSAYARVVLPMKGSGDVKINQKVNIKLSNYPSKTYGTITGNVIAKSRIPEKSNYIITVELPD